MGTVTKNPLREVGYISPPPCDGVGAFHRRMSAYAPTNLFDSPDLADQLRVGRILVKAETRRMGLPSFKILGASWATYQALCGHLGYEPEPWRNVSELAANLEHLRPFRIAAATDGNHGRAVAFMARVLGFQCHIFVPKDMVEPRIQAMRSEGAIVTVVDGTYDDDAARSAEEASSTCLVVSDTSWEGYEDTPAQVIEGYSTIFNEVEDALAASSLSQPDVVAIPMGVGAFMASGVAHYRQADRQPLIVGVEPVDANCVEVSAEAGGLKEVPGPHESIMVGLNCGTPSMIAWPRIAAGVDWVASIDDNNARAAMRTLADVGIVAGETGAASLAGFSALRDSPEWHTEEIDLSDATVLIVVTEGATDPANYDAIVGRGHETVGRVLKAIR